jgi:hypothetical protein
LQVCHFKRGRRLEAGAWVERAERTDARAVLHFAPPSRDGRRSAGRALSRFATNKCYLKRFGAGAATHPPIAAPRQAAVGRGARPAAVALLAPSASQLSGTHAYGIAHRAERCINRIKHRRQAQAQNTSKTAFARAVMIGWARVLSQ